ncbi:MAG TPA: fluoride efflux transporter CrcB [Pyrinomonadaceae bacterium]
METWTRYLAVALGGALGAMLRYYLGGSALARATAPLPVPTFLINVSGSFLLGLFLTAVAERLTFVGPHVRLAFAVGFVGAYTTFSTFEYETALLVEGRRFGLALAYVVLSCAAGFGAVGLGIWLARGLGGAR